MEQKESRGNVKISNSSSENMMIALVIRYESAGFIHQRKNLECSSIFGKLKISIYWHSFHASR